MKKAKNPQIKPKKQIKKTIGTNWQTGDYERFANYKFILPYPFLLLCKLFDVTPIQAIADFMDAFSCAKSNDQGQLISTELLQNYVTELGYGNRYYSVSDVHQILQEMNSITMLWPKNAKMDLINKHSKWLKHYQKYWFKKWYYSTRRGGIKK